MVFHRSFAVHFSATGTAIVQLTLTAPHDTRFGLTLVTFCETKN